MTVEPGRNGKVCLFFFIFYFILEYSQLTMLPWFQVHSKGTQPYIYMCPFSPTLSSKQEGVFLFSFFFYLFILYCGIAD